MKPFNLKEYRKDPTKKIVARDGRDARIICTNKEGNDAPIVALIKDKYGESIRAYLINGRQSNEGDTQYDLFFKTEKKEGWVNVFKTDIDMFKSGRIYNSETEAKESVVCDGKYVDTVKIEWEE